MDGDLGAGVRDHVRTPGDRTSSAEVLGGRGDHRGDATGVPEGVVERSRRDDLPRGAAHDAVYVVRVDTLPGCVDQPSIAGVVGVSVLPPDVLPFTAADLLRRGSLLPRVGRGSDGVAGVSRAGDDVGERRVGSREDARRSTFEWDVPLGVAAFVGSRRVLRSGVGIDSQSIESFRITFISVLK